MAREEVKNLFGIVFCQKFVSHSRFFYLLYVIFFEEEITHYSVELNKCSAILLFKANDYKLNCLLMIRSVRLREKNELNSLYIGFS